jgi:cytochrome oxidase Cu insertion factor (SCO1/SenC/PrrC family)
MTEADIQYLKDNIDKEVVIQTADGEQLVAKILFVSHDEEHDEHDVLYKVISSNMHDSYTHLDKAGGYVLDFKKIISVSPYRL